MLFTCRVTAGQEVMVTALIHEKIRKTHAQTSAIIVSPSLRGYVIMEAKDEVEARQACSNVPHVKGLLHKAMTIEDISEFLVSKPVEVTLNKGDLVEILMMPFKGERAKIVRVNKEKEEVTVELIEVAVPIPVTIKLHAVKLVPT
jgi:transcriptional antiterminator NusG